MMLRVQELCRRLKPVLGRKVDALWAAYLADADADGKADIEQTLELLASKHLGVGYQPDRSPFPPPSKQFAASGDVGLGQVSYGDRNRYPFFLKSGRLKEHILIAGRSGSGKTNLTFVLMQGIMARGIKVVALDWKRGYRDLLPLRSDLRVYTVARHRFNGETQNRIKQEYAYHAVARQQHTLGRTVERRMLDNGEIEVVIGGYR